MKIDKKTVKVIFWDTAGQEGFSSLTKQYYREADGAIIVYDITNMSSFKDIKNWMDDVKRETNNKAIMILVGNKSDKIYEREVKTQVSEIFAKNNSMFFMETSAKDNVNVKPMFETLIRMLMERAKTSDVTYSERQYRKPLLDEETNHCCALI